MVYLEQFERGIPFERLSSGTLVGQHELAFERDRSFQIK